MTVANVMVMVMVMVMVDMQRCRGLGFLDGMGTQGPHLLLMGWGPKDPHYVEWDGETQRPHEWDGETQRPHEWDGETQRPHEWDGETQRPHRSVQRASVRARSPLLFAGGG